MEVSMCCVPVNQHGVVTKGKLVGVVIAPEGFSFVFLLQGEGEYESQASYMGHDDAWKFFCDHNGSKAHKQQCVQCNKFFWVIDNPEIIYDYLCDECAVQFNKEIGF